jgi:hypothetical protein
MKYYQSAGLRSEFLHWRKWRLRQRYYAQAQAATIKVVPESAEFLSRVA